MESMPSARWLLVIGAMAVSSSMVSSASAIEAPLSVVGQDQLACPSVSQNSSHDVTGGCQIHLGGEMRLFLHIFGIESTEATCHVEFEGRLNETGVGFITSYVSTNGGHGNTNCATVSPACAGTLPWPGAGEEDAGNQTTAHFDVCIDPVESGTCEGEFITDVTESGTEPERQHFQADDLRIGNAFCEVTIDVETEVDPVPPHQNVHIKSN